MRSMKKNSEVEGSGRRERRRKKGEAAAELKKGPWTAEEDQLLVEFIRTHGEGGWRTLPRRAGLLRCGKSCRLRWMNYLRPNIKRGHISHDEEDLILRLHRLLGNRWSLIAGRIPGRTDNEIKNYWNTHLSKKLINQGIDPRTHKPFFNKSTDHTVVEAPSVKPSSATATVSPSDGSCRRRGDPNQIQVSQKTQTQSPTTETSKKKDGSFTEYEDNNMVVNQLMWPSYGTNATSSSDDDGIIIHDVNANANAYANGDGDDDDDVFSSFLNSLINDDDMIFPCNAIAHDDLLPIDNSTKNGKSSA